MKTSALAVALAWVACLTSDLDAQETDERSIISPERSNRFAGPAVEESTTGSFFLRLNSLNGEFESGEDGGDWDEVWNNGVGFGFDLTWLIPVGKQIHVGPYGSITLDMFQGKEIVDEDIGGNEVIEFDPLMTTRIVLGLASRQTFGRIFVEERLGLGGGYYFETDFDFSAPGFSESGTVIEATMVATFEARLLAGMRPSESSELVMGVGFEAMGAPNNDDSEDSFFSDASFKRMESFVITIAFSFHF
jgi:hypothetical protein